VEDPELIQQLRAQDRTTLRERARRLSFLARFKRPGARALPYRSYEYIEDARMCWLVGAHLAAIVMAQLAAEELLRAIFRTWGLSHLDERAGFARLITEGRKRGLITDEEAEQLHALRRIRNELAHVRYGPPTEERRADLILAQGPHALEDAAQQALTTVFTFILNRPPMYWVTPGPLA